MTYQERIRSSQYVNDFGRDGEPTSNLIKSKIEGNNLEKCLLDVMPEDRGLLRTGQDHDEVGHPAYLLPTPRQSLSSEHNI